MSIVTLTTDLGNYDHYVAKVKGALLSQNPNLNIVDISHQVEPFNLISAAFLLKNSFDSFPKGSVHILSVLTSSISSDAPNSFSPDHLAFSYKGHYFIGPNNGIFPMIYDERPEDMVFLEIEELDDHQSFSIGNLYCRAAAHLANKGPLNMLGSKATGIFEKSSLHPSYIDSHVQGAVVYIDHFGNLITNIQKDAFNLTKKNRPFTIELGFRGHTVNEICRWYGEVSKGDLMALFNSDNHLEIAINQGDAHKLLGLKVQDQIRIDFNDY